MSREAQLARALTACNVKIKKLEADLNASALQLETCLEALRAAEASLRGDFDRYDAEDAFAIIQAALSEFEEEP